MLDTLHDIQPSGAHRARNIRPLPSSTVNLRHIDLIYGSQLKASLKALSGDVVFLFPRSVPPRVQHELCHLSDPDWLLSFVAHWDERSQHGHETLCAKVNFTDVYIDRATLCERYCTLAPKDVLSVMSTVYGMPYLLEDKTGKLTGSDFVDMNDRLRLRLSCTAQAPTHTAYMIHNATHGHDPLNPLIALAFGPNNSLGTITTRSGAAMPMSQYLAKLSPLGSSMTRKFIGSDGQEYRWSWRTTKGHEWTCTNRSQYLVAFYSLKVAGEPDYLGSSGCMLTVDEAYPHLVAEVLASLTIMRHIAAHGL